MVAWPVDKNGAPVPANVMPLPLHVRVAEALGCKPVFKSSEDTPFGGSGWHCVCESPCPGLLRYDTDGGATVPLMERFGIGVERLPGPWEATKATGSRWASACGPTLLDAVCNLIVQLHATGELHG